MSRNKVFLIDRLLAIPLVVYFWWYGHRQKIGKRRKKNLPDTTSDSGVKSE